MSTRLVVFQTPERCLFYNSDGTVTDAMPETIKRYIGSNVEEVSMLASSVLRYRVEED